MEPGCKERTERCLKMEANVAAELAQTRDELKRAKDKAMQSWLDSRPLVDELERMKSDLESAKNSVSISDAIISALKSQLESTNEAIRCKKEEEHKAREMVREMNEVLDPARDELERTRREADQKRDKLKRLKQILQVRRQMILAQKLRLRAVRIESEAFGSSAADALHHIEFAREDSTTLELTHEEYYALIRRAKKATELADWRVSIAVEKKLGAEERLEKMKSVYRSRGGRVKKNDDGKANGEVEEEEVTDKRRSHFPRAREKFLAQAEKPKDPQNDRRSRMKARNKTVPKKKPSFWGQIKRFFLRRILRFFE